MTNLAAAMADTDGLQDFEGKPVLRSVVAITGAGDGLSEAMAVDPVEYHQGERVYVVLECMVAKVTFEPIDKTDPGGAQKRKHSFAAGTATVMDADVVKEAIAEQADRIAAAKEAAAGITRIPFGDDGGDPEADPEAPADPDELGED